MCELCRSGPLLQCLLARWVAVARQRPIYAVQSIQGSNPHTFIDGQTAYRGCSSDIDSQAGKQFCATNAKQCYQCAKRGCNDNRPKMIDTVACVKCNSTSNPNCAALTTPVNATLCKPFADGYVNYCFTRVANETVTRGCVLEHDSLIADCNSWYSTACEECMGNNCNKQAIRRESCIECNSKVDRNCTANPDDYMRKQCPLALKPAGCYRRIQNGKYFYWFSLYLLLPWNWKWNHPHDNIIVFIELEHINSFKCPFGMHATFKFFFSTVIVLYRVLINWVYLY